MNLNLSDLNRKLIAAARATPSDNQVPYAFEKRIMALVAGKSAVDPWDIWGRALTRAAACCVVLMLLMAAGSYYLFPRSNQDSLSVEAQKTLFAAVDNSADQAGDVQ